MDNQTSNRTNQLPNMQPLAATLAQKLKSSVGDDVWADAVAEHDSAKEIAIHHAQRAMLQAAEYIESVTGDLSAIIDELSGVSNDPDSHVNEALRLVTRMLAKAKGN